MTQVQRPLRILIGTPAAGGLITLQYFLSMLQTVNRLSVNRREGERQIDVGIYTLGNESLVSRGRDHIAAVALYQKWDKLFFIDADAGWSFEQFYAIAASDKPLIAGVCPLKVYPISMNYLPLPDDEHHYKENVRSLESLQKMRLGHGTSEINIGFVGTAFMCIDVARVLLPLSEIAAPFKYPNPATGKNRTQWQFFPTVPIKGEATSEDWGFVHLARKVGIEPFINADVVITHTGTHTFSVEGMLGTQQAAYDSRRAK